MSAQFRAEGAEMHAAAKVLRISGNGDGRVVHAEVEGGFASSAWTRSWLTWAGGRNTGGMGLEPGWGGP
jgi:hypothetical protein